MSDSRQRAKAQLQENIHRLSCVLQNLPDFKHATTCHLAEVALMWGMAALAEDEDQSVCSRRFFALSDRMFASTFEALQLLDEASRNELADRADITQRELDQQVCQIANRSVQALSLFPEEYNRRVVFDAMYDVLSNFLPHIRLADLTELITRCLNMNLACDFVRFGTIEENECNSKIKDLYLSINRILEEIAERVSSGQLIIADGELVDPNADMGSGDV
ncbi:hypothetical protein [Planctellipticum variicoloris]|uniref:hypothetical protein n=1 Tax=Planctellipticum variicoloris TaxID=3064265 RepID=UPI003013F288|nr:hypothetical protein SH412_000546 [Planctomycetaceae bacterium SH412]